MFPDMNHYNMSWLIGNMVKWMRNPYELWQNYNEIHLKSLRVRCPGVCSATFSTTRGAWPDARRWWGLGSGIFMVFSWDFCGIYMVFSWDLHGLNVMACYGSWWRMANNSTLSQEFLHIFTTPWLGMEYWIFHDLPVLGWTYAPFGMGLEDDVQPVMWPDDPKRENRRRFTCRLCSKSCDMLGLWWKATFGTGQFKFYLWNQRRWGF